MEDYVAKYWHPLSDGKIQCDLCPRYCRLKDGQRGLCYVRKRVGNNLILVTYGRSSGFCIDPIEKKPLNHFFPNSAVLSFGTAGCNLACKFCQNWDISRSKEFHRLTEQASPMAIANAAVSENCKSVALTYNDPVVFLEYGMDVAKACQAHNVKVVAVTNGYINEPARNDFFSLVDAANVDLKSFSESFYKKLTGGDLQTVLDTLIYLRTRTNVWLEITTLLIPFENDSEKEIKQLTNWVLNELGPETPLHFSAFHPDFKMRDRPVTPLKTLVRARNIAMDCGLNYVYTGNVHHRDGDTTFCKKCGQKVIERDWYELTQYQLTITGACVYCNTQLDGHFDELPGRWGSKRRPIRV